VYIVKACMSTRSAAQILSMPIIDIDVFVFPQTAQVPFTTTMQVSRLCVSLTFNAIRHRKMEIKEILQK